LHIAKLTYLWELRLRVLVETKPPDDTKSGPTSPARYRLNVDSRTFGMDSTATIKVPVSTWSTAAAAVQMPQVIIITQSSGVDIRT